MSDTMGREIDRWITGNGGEDSVSKDDFDPGYEQDCEDCKARLTFVDENGTSHGCASWDEMGCCEHDDL